ncbi:hypothetical protein A2197_00385 [Candidatus Woesebacteria bacterium RIFOXYA1_FULL_48_16]|uniref:Phage Gp37/Gp68 family protein n=1 Tax=Candidatus Woesebacteria bacterium RIFOXYA1_FULL_48_16 TaxID=1802535 RepID=A0A1F8CMS8_9BACT|nr:MAG: hypothetical protein A2197_00385 [Candidatus Woesebacteria bacterium RIFOXYA1_FULL_48_16]
MGYTTGVQWTNRTHNFWYGCKKVSAGCKFCYAERDMERYGRDFNTVTRAKGFDTPLNWKEPALVFVNSWSDFFISDADEWRNDAWDVIRKTQHLIYQILTKRPENIKDRLPPDWGNGWGNVWLGVSAENQMMADKRIPILLSIPAKIRFVSAEPLLGPVDISMYLSTPPDFSRIPNSGDGISYPFRRCDWIITGGESGYTPRLSDTDWFRSIRDQCVSANVPFFFKQVGGSKKINGTWGGDLLDGKVWHEFPDTIATEHTELQPELMR